VVLVECLNLEVATVLTLFFLVLLQLAVAVVVTLQTQMVLVVVREVAVPELAQGLVELRIRGLQVLTELESIEQVEAAAVVALLRTA
jgi:hypothetical protein